MELTMIEKNSCELADEARAMGCIFVHGSYVGELDWKKEPDGTILECGRFIGYAVDEEDFDELAGVFRGFDVSGYTKKVEIMLDARVGDDGELANKLHRGVPLDLFIRPVPDRIFANHFNHYEIAKVLE